MTEIFGSVLRAGLYSNQYTAFILLKLFDKRIEI